MDNVFWAFGRHSYPLYEEFIKNVTEYNETIAPGEHKWDPDTIIYEGPLTVDYEAMWKNEGDDDSLEIIVSDKVEPISMGCILHTLHQESLSMFEGADDEFFEGSKKLIREDLSY